MTRADPPEPPSLATLLRALIDHARMLVEAESGYWRRAAAYALDRARTIALLVVLAVFFVFFALMALVVGLLLALAPLIGAWGALALVTGATALAALVCARRALANAKRMMGLLRDDT